MKDQIGLGTQKEEPAPTTEPPPAPPPAAPKPAPRKELGEDDPYAHDMQLGVRAGIVPGYNMILRYDDSPYCSKPDPAKEHKDQQKFCGHVAPLAIDVAVSFAPIGWVEPYLWGRFGLQSEPETNTQELQVFGVGTRLYTTSSSRFKVAIEPAVGLELEKGLGNPDYAFPPTAGKQAEYKQDVYIHIGAGPQYDFASWGGAYAVFGFDSGILRSLHFTMEAQIGFQLRLQLGPAPAAAK